MSDNERSDPPSKRYNTRPKTISSLVALENKYSAYIVETSPKASKRSRNLVIDEYSDYQRYVYPQMVSRTVKPNLIDQEYAFRNFQGYQMAGEPMNSTSFHGRNMNTGFNNMYQPNHGPTMTPNMNMMYSNQHYGMHMNYQPSQIPHVIVPQPQNVRVVSPMMYPLDTPNYSIPSEHFNPNLKIPMRIHPGYNVPHPSFVSHTAQQDYGSPNFKPNLSFPRPTQSDPPMNTMDRSNVAQTFGVQNVMYNQIVTPVTKEFENQVDFLPKAELDKHVPRTPEEDEINHYFKAVDVILKDISDTSKFERYGDSSFGCVSIVDGFKLTDPYRMVNFEYTITHQMYLEITKYLDSVSRADVHYPLNISQIKINGNRVGNHDHNSNNLTADGANGELKTNTNSDPATDKVNQINLEFTNNNIKLKHERTIYPITIDSYKQLSVIEARSLMSLLKDSNVVKANPISKNRIKIIINNHDDTNSNYWVYFSEDSSNEYVLKHQIGSFAADDFLNKRVPLYTNVDFGKTDPSFLFGAATNRKITKLAHMYGEVSRSYDLFLTKLNANINLGLSKIIPEYENDTRKAIHTLSIRCNILYIPTLFKTIHVNC